jgi:hypothetical protein
MKIFALETDIQRVKNRFLAHSEKEIFTARPHVLRFISSILWEIFLTVVFGCIAAYLYFGFSLDLRWVLGLFGGAWLLVAFFPIMQSFIDWRYDLIFLTTDKLVIVDQVSLFRKSITPINLENLGDVVAQTQWLSLFNFGIIHFALKEGQGPEIILRFMPEADKLVAKISQQITLYQRRKDYLPAYRRYPSADAR